MLCLAVWDTGGDESCKGREGKGTKEESAFPGVV